MWIHTWVDSELHNLWQFKSLIWGISSGFPLANHFDLSGSESNLVSLRILPRVYMHFLGKMDSTEEAYG